jgi:hypothetical protein
MTEKTDGSFHLTEYRSSAARFVKLADGLDVAPALRELAAHPALWDARTARKLAPGSPHAAMSDIWLRYRDPAELTCAADYLAPHDSVFYPAWRSLPAVQAIVGGLVGRLRPRRLGGILITRIPPGAGIAPHHDRGGWHAEFYDLKLYTILEGNPGCRNICEQETVVMKPGETWSFDNLRVHSVENRGVTPRTTLITCLRAA